jgi:hypothetical protein
MRWFFLGSRNKDCWFLLVGYAEISFIQYIQRVYAKCELFYVREGKTKLSFVPSSPRLIVPAPLVEILTLSYQVL